MKESHLEVRNISHSYSNNGNRLPVLEEVNFSVEEGHLGCLIGPSGCGKSTLFNIMAGLELPDRGEIILQGTPITGSRGHIAYMPQSDLLFPWRTLLQNAVLGAEVTGQSKAETKRKARQLLPLFGLEGFGDARPHELSGGMRQRAALLRTVLLDRDILALDEPFGALDALTRSKMQKWLLSVWEELETTIIFVTHDMEESLILGDRVFVMSDRPGTIIETVPVELKRPRDKTGRKFILLKQELLEALSLNGEMEISQSGLDVTNH